jgi:hypothetical protein
MHWKRIMMKDHTILLCRNLLRKFYFCSAVELQLILFAACPDFNVCANRQQ